MRILGPTKVEVSGKILTSFAGTNYLGLSFHPNILAALTQSTQQSGLGLGASRKTTGTTEEVLALEQKLAHFTGAESAIATTSATLANIGVIEGLHSAIDHWLIDEQAHTSFANFLPLSGASVHRYKHLDPQDLARQLAPLQGKVGIFTDTVFALTGEIAPLQQIADAAPNALLVFDEAHSIGAFGRGLVAEAGLYTPRTLVTTTFTKALGCVGGAILGPRPLIEKIRDRSAILAATSALPPALSSAVIAAIQVLKDEPQRQARLHSNCRIMRESLGLPSQAPAAPIFSKLDHAAELSSQAHDAGFLVPVLSSYPGSAPGGMLRWIVSSEHTEAEIRTVSAILSRL